MKDSYSLSCFEILTKMLVKLKNQWLMNTDLVSLFLCKESSDILPIWSRMSLILWEDSIRPWTDYSDNLN